MKYFTLRTSFVRISSIIGLMAALLILLCADVTRQARGSNLAKAHFVAVDSKGRNGTKNQKDGSGAKPTQGKKKTKPGGTKAHAGSAGTSLAQDSVQIEQRIRRARAYAVSKDYAKAEQELRLVLARDPKNFAAYNNLGNVFFLQGNLDSAEVNYFLALPRAAIVNDSLGIRLNLGALFYIADSQAVAVEILLPVLNDSSDVDRVEQLLGLDFEKISTAPASLGKNRRLSAGDMKKLVFSVLEAKQDLSDDRGSQQTKSLAMKPQQSQSNMKQAQSTKASAAQVPTTLEETQVAVKKPRTKPGGRKGWCPPDMIEDVFFWAASSDSKSERSTH